MAVLVSYWFISYSLFHSSSFFFLVPSAPPSSKDSHWDNNEYCYYLNIEFTISHLALQIIRSPSYSFSANISVEGCATSTMWGQYCNQTIDPFSCSQAYSYNPTEIFSGANLQTIQNVVSCKTFESYCHGEGEPKVYALEVLGIAEQLKIVAANVSFTAAPTNSTGNASVANLLYFARHGAMPSMALYDYSGDKSKAPLIIRKPKVGRWFVTILPTNLSKEVGGIQNTNMQVCYSITWQLLNCPVGKAGLNCSSEKYMLQVNCSRNVCSLNLDYNIF